MGVGSQEAIKQLKALIDQVDERLQITFQANEHLAQRQSMWMVYRCPFPVLKLHSLNYFVGVFYQNIHQGYPNENLIRFLKAREWNVSRAHKMLVDCFNWRIENEVDNMLSKPIVPIDLYREVRESQLIGLSGHSKEGLPVFAVGVGLSTLDKASVHYYVQSHIQINEYRDRVVLPAATKKHGRHIGTCFKVLDMTGLKISALRQIKLLTTIATIDDLNYPEKTEKYYIVNVPSIFSACWKVVKPLLQERTRKKIQVLQGCGQDELLKVMDYSSLPNFCKREGSGSSCNSIKGVDDCFSLDHWFHQQLYGYVKEQSLTGHPGVPTSQGYFHVPEPGTEEPELSRTIESELHESGDGYGINHSEDDLLLLDD